MHSANTLNTTDSIRVNMECPACGSSVTLEVGPDHPISTALLDAVLATEEDECIELSRHCWNCGWGEERQLRVASIDTTPGDETVVERAAIIDDITDELAAIENLETLKDARAEVRRQGRLDPSTDNMETDRRE
ncbi:MAG: hypothetical protein ACI8XM_000057 [Haloarculaceae archaeon]|jgi:hypothetical protein